MWSSLIEIIIVGKISDAIAYEPLIQISKAFSNESIHHLVVLVFVLIAMLKVI